MATRKKTTTKRTDQVDELVVDMITSLNKEAKEKVAFTFDDEDNPSNIVEWISTGLKGLDYIISNRSNGGIPVGRITNIVGEEGAGKTLLATKLAAECQKGGGVVVYFDVESALSAEFSEALGLDRKSTMLVAGNLYIEKIFEMMETIIEHIRVNYGKKKQIMIIWDSIAATPSKEEDAEAYDKAQMGVRARAISKGLRKITQKIANQRIALVLINQLRMDLRVTYGDNSIQPGGKAIPYHSSVIVKVNKKNFESVGAGEKKEGVSVDCRAKIVKNRCGPPQREWTFTIDYTKGPHEHETLLRMMGRMDPELVDYDGDKYMFNLSTGAWNTAVLYDPEANPAGKADGEVIKTVKFQKGSAPEKFFGDEDWSGVIEQCMDLAFVKKYKFADSEIDTSSAFEVQSILSDMEEMADNLESQ